MYEGRFRQYFYVGITKFVGIGILILMSMIYSFLVYYSSIDYGGYINYLTIRDSVAIIIDIIVFVFIALAFNEIISNYPKLKKANNVRISAAILSLMLLLDMIFVIVLYQTGLPAIAYVLGTFYILTSFLAAYVPIMIHGYFNDEDNMTNIKIVNKSFIILGFALGLYYLLFGIGVMIQNEAAFAFNILSSTASSVSYVAFIIAATGMILYSKKANEMSRVTEMSP